MTLFIHLYKYFFTHNILQCYPDWFYLSLQNKIIARRSWETTVGEKEATKVSIQFCYHNELQNKWYIYIYWFWIHISNNWYFSEGKALAELAFNNRSLRDALLATTESVAVGIHVENWSTYRLWQPEYDMEKGRTYSEEAAKLAGTLPGTVCFCTKM